MKSIKKILKNHPKSLNFQRKTRVFSQKWENTKNHEINLIEERIVREKHPEKLFFAYANTVATIDFAKKYKGHGWLGIRYQTKPDEAYQGRDGDNRRHVGSMSEKSSDVAKQIW